MKQGTSSLKDFELVSKLGEGSFAEVYKMRRKQDGQCYAVKKIRMSRIKEKDRQNALNEGEHVIEFKEAFYDDSSSHLCVVMEFAGRGDLQQLIKSHAKRRAKVPEEEIWRALVHICRGLKSLHDKKIIHRDLKSANVFITEDGTYKLGDLNVSKVAKQDLAKTQTGTPYYASPEVWKDQPYGTQSDMWSLGCVLYQMAAQRPPFTATDLQMLFKKVCAGVFPRIPAQYSNSLAGVIASLLKTSPGDRPSADRLLNNPVVQGHYKGEETLGESWAREDLLSTIVFNSRNWKEVNKVLPKAQYQKRSSKELADPKQQIVAEVCGNKENQSSNNNGRNTGSGKRDRSSSTYVGVAKIENQRERIISVIDNIQKQCDELGKILPPRPRHPAESHRPSKKQPAPPSMLSTRTPKVEPRKRVESLQQSRGPVVVQESSARRSSSSVHPPRVNSCAPRRMVQAGQHILRDNSSKLL